MTREQAIALDSNPVWKAFKEGKEVEVYEGMVWKPTSYVELYKLARYENIYRIKPTLKRVPLGPEDIKPGDILKGEHWPNGVWGYIQPRISFVSFSNGEIKYNELMIGYLISHDGGKTWLPCWKEVAE